MSNYSFVAYTCHWKKLLKTWKISWSLIFANKSTLNRLSRRKCCYPRKTKMSMFRWKRRDETDKDARRLPNSKNERRNKLKTCPFVSGVCLDECSMSQTRHDQTNYKVCVKPNLSNINVSIEHVCKLLWRFFFLKLYIQLTHICSTTQSQV